MPESVLLAVQRLYLAQLRQLDLQFFERPVEQLIHLLLLLARPAPEAGIGAFARHRRRARRRVEPAHLSQLAIAQHLTSHRGGARTLQDAGGDQRVSHWPHRVVVEAVTAAGFKQQHQRFVRECNEGPAASARHHPAGRSCRYHSAPSQMPPMPLQGSPGSGPKKPSPLYLIACIPLTDSATPWSNLRALSAL